MTTKNYEIPHGITWKKLKKMFEANLHPDLAGRLTFQSTSYRRADSAMELLRVVWDKTNIAKMDWWVARNMCNGLSEVERANQGKHDSNDFKVAMKLSLAVPVKILLQSDDYLARAIGLMDKRCGKRSLEKYDIENEKHQFVKDIYSLRKKQSL